MILALALFGASMLALCTCSARRRAAPPSSACLENYKEVLVLLQAGEALQAQARAALIHCEHFRAQALKLTERSRPLGAGDETAGDVP
jgi:hypothetical protein